MTGPSTETLVSVFLGWDPPTFMIACSRLEDAGITFSTKTDGVYGSLTCPPEILVRTRDASRARQVLKALPAEIPEPQLAVVATKTLPEEEKDSSLVGIEGLLMVLGVLLFLLPLWIGYNLIETLLHLNSKQWQDFITPGGSYYHPAWKVYRIVTPVAEAALLLGALFAFDLFRRKSRRFPVAMMILLSADFLVELVDVVFLGRMATIDLSNFQEVSGLVGRAMLCMTCLPYLATSERVGATFTD
jgi:hypothetical protein